MGPHYQTPQQLGLQDLAADLSQSCIRGGYSLQMHHTDSTTGSVTRSNKSTTVTIDHLLCNMHNNCPAVPKQHSMMSAYQQLP
jgi:hypothetical protein